MLQAIMEAILEPIFEVVVRLPGWLLLKYLWRQRGLDFASTRVVFIGLLFWLVIVALIASLIFIQTR